MITIRFIDADNKDKIIWEVEVPDNNAFFTSLNRRDEITLENVKYDIEDRHFTIRKDFQMIVFKIYKKRLSNDCV